MWAGRVTGAGLLAAMAGIHLYLWDTGYRTIDIIGPLFLVNAVLGALLCLAVLVAIWQALLWSSAAGAALAAGTLLGLIECDRRAVWVHRIPARFADHTHDRHRSRSYRDPRCAHGVPRGAPPPLHAATQPRAAPVLGLWQRPGIPDARLRKESGEWAMTPIARFWTLWAAEGLSVVGLVVSAVVHLRLAGVYAEVAGTISEATLFRAQAVGAVIVVVLLLVRPTRLVWVAASGVAVASLVAATGTVYLAVPAFGPFPRIHDPGWYPDTALAAAAVAVTAVAAAVGTALSGRSPSQLGTR